MKRFTTLLNPLIPIGRLSFTLFFLMIPVWTAYSIISNPKDQTIELLILMIFISILFILIGYMFLQPLMRETKNYTISEESIELFDFVTFKKKRLDASTIKGFSTSSVSYRIGNFKQVIIYLANGEKLELMKFSYFNFKQITKVLIQKNYKYLGHENYESKWLFGRIYKFD